MSLKMFHVVFISAAIVLCLGFGFWCFNQGARTGMGVGSMIVAAALVIYEVFFFKKFNVK